MRLDLAVELDLSFCLDLSAFVGLRLVAPREALGEMEIVLPTFFFLADAVVADLMLSLSLAFLNARLFFSLANKTSTH